MLPIRLEDKTESKLTPDGTNVESAAGLEEANWMIESRRVRTKSAPKSLPKGDRILESQKIQEFWHCGVVEIGV
jgi:hypothetical protein